MEVDELAAGLMRQRRVPAHPLLLFVALDSCPYGDDRELGVLDLRVRGSATDSILETARNRNCENDAPPYFPRHLSSALAHEANELTIGVVRDHPEGRLTKCLEHRQAKLALESDGKLGRTQHGFLPESLEKVRRRDVDQLELIDCFEGTVVDQRSWRNATEHRVSGVRHALDRQQVHSGEHGDSSGHQS